MKEIKEWKSGKHCFGNYLVIDGKDFETLDEEEVTNFIVNQLKITQNRSYLLQEILKMVLEDMDFEIVEDDSYSCEQCGDWNHHTKYRF